MKLVKTVGELVNAMHRSDIDAEKILRTLAILGLQTQDVRKSTESGGSDRSNVGAERLLHIDKLKRSEKSILESSSCDICFYMNKIMGVEEEISRIRLDLNGLFERVALLDKKKHR